MITYKSKIIIASALLIYGMLGIAFQLVAQETEGAPGKEKALDHTLQYTNAQHLLDEISFEYIYKEGGSLKIAFYDGKLKYEWISGPRKGNNAKDIPYQSREIGDDLYIINWHEKNKPDFTSLIINLNKKVLHSSAILRYGTSSEMIHFKEATIERVKRPVK